jgi:glycosyltransferase involved in cell wall biosynthesis
LWAKLYQARLEGRSFDLIFSPFTQHLAYLETDIPMVAWADATFGALNRLYNAERPLCRENLKAANFLESKALAKFRLAIYASDWAADSAMKDYGLLPERVAVIPYGANLEFTPEQNQVEQSIADRSRELMELLFIGVDYERKGGPCAVEVARRLNAAGVPARLTIVGCRPPIDEPFVKVLGFLSKSHPRHRERLEAALRRSHFFILPSKAECYGVVFCEASSFGVPSIATRVGGIPSAVRDGVNGRLFPPNPDPGDIAAWIMSITGDEESYRRLALSSYQEYAERLNWTSAGKRVVRALERVVAECGSRIAPTQIASG